MEQIIGSLAGVKAHTHDTVYDLLVTTERVVAALVQHPLDVPLRFGMAEFFLGRGLANLQERAQRASIGEERRRAFEGLSPDELLAAHPRNFEVRYGTVTRTELKQGRLGSWLTFHLATPLGNRGRVRFSLGKRQLPEARRLLEGVLPPGLLSS